jgi:Na+-translocating ferredoxin:NAD+ oxidoreductase RNF subunit RnfB
VQAIAFPLTTVLPLPVVATECCTGCGACVGACPVHAIELRSSRREAA